MAYKLACGTLYTDIEKYLNQLGRVNKNQLFILYWWSKLLIIARRIHPYLYSFAFFEQGGNVEVMQGNDDMMKMHNHYGFTHVAAFKDYIYKYDQFHDVE